MAQKTANQLRIIGGDWRSRRFVFPDALGLRPTPDRVRETLFNWLAPVTPGARVLDPFAGSGALLLEALSRGASQALAFDLNAQAANALRSHLQALDCTRAEVRQTDALQALAKPVEATFDLVFLDPPFGKALLEPACQALEDHGWLAADAWIYTESETQPSRLALPATWQLHREKKTGNVHYALWHRQA
ncbi:16S rRNA (guanine(966)-N(2))-methyltransferase RsmD [Pseudomonas oryzihabitans]|uniref:16S rRNA (guanine(966)-N(2))-methyltransferase RsmD n=1 Tax=Pseudomonas oryzihabitans TaxID=47885 RepID=UPI00111CAA23|nr:16S rRNA (guanine(966)-N(2))-methyltransferase RsmD [Pseudomonas psychrotolerans]QDD91129.1 16S rRNA (guanine(966)-N(2))-methyltransferase RsmD [Pseudomonas psychrotolerans]